MKVVQINATSGSGSTGKICAAISKILRENGIENFIFYSSGQTDDPYSYKYMSNFLVKAGALEARIRGNYGFNSSLSTYKLINQIKTINPDIVHIHNIHNHNCNLELLFSYLKAENKKIIWTFHDCWAFTGHCVYFTFSQCSGWLHGCKNCPRPREFSWFIDTSEKLYRKKQKILSNLDLTIVTPSIWLETVTKDSFLGSYPIQVINNGIDLQMFYPRKHVDSMKYGIVADKIVILGVSYNWEKRKGLDVFIELAGRLNNDYQLVLVGTNDEVDRLLPKRILSIHRTENQEDLAQIYSASSVFLNPTREDNFPTVNMEALACGTPVITFHTGGSPEVIDDTCGAVVSDNIECVIQAIQSVISSKTITSENCIKKSRNFDQAICFKKYLLLYQGIIDSE